MEVKSILIIALQLHDNFSATSGSIELCLFVNRVGQMLKTQNNGYDLALLFITVFSYRSFCMHEKHGALCMLL